MKGVGVGVADALIKTRLTGKEGKRRSLGQF